MYHAWKRPGRKPSTVGHVSLASLRGSVRFRIWLTAERDVYETVSRANASLYPIRKRREEDGDKAEEDVAAAHFELIVLRCCARCSSSVEELVRLS